MVVHVPDTDEPVGVMFAANLTVAGNVSVTFRDGSTMVMTLPIGYSEFDYEIRRVNVAGTTATGTYYNLVG
ncbi:MAG: hypothetical protein ACRCYS_00410 [Beijerinckiaceae bacterium]